MPLTDVELAELRAIINEPSSFVFYKTLMEGVLERLDAAEKVIAALKGDVPSTDIGVWPGAKKAYQTWQESKRSMMAGIDLPPDLNVSNGGMRVALTKIQREHIWANINHLFPTLENRGAEVLRAYETTVVALEAQLVGLADLRAQPTLSLQRENDALNRLAEATRLLERSRDMLNHNGRTWREIDHFLRSR